MTDWGATMTIIRNYVTGDEANAVDQRQFTSDRRPYSCCVGALLGILGFASLGLCDVLWVESWVWSECGQCGHSVVIVWSEISVETNTGEEITGTANKKRWRHRRLWQEIRAVMWGHHGRFWQGCEVITGDSGSDARSSREIQTVVTINWAEKCRQFE